MRPRAVVLALVLAGAAGVGPAAAQTDIGAWPIDGDPATDYARASQLFRDGDRQVATCLFFRGQYRARVYLGARPDLPLGGAPALYAALNQTVGTQINGWAAGDVEDWASAMDCALRWAETTDDPQTPRADYPAVHAEVAAGLRDLAAHVRANADSIRAQRTANGLENR